MGHAFGPSRQKVHAADQVVSCDNTQLPGVPSNIWWVYSPQIFDGWGSVKYLGGLQPPNI